MLNQVASTHFRTRPATYAGWEYEKAKEKAILSWALDMGELIFLRRILAWRVVFLLSCLLQDLEENVEGRLQNDSALLFVSPKSRL